MWTAVRRSSARCRSGTVRAVRNGSMRAGPASKPSPRRIRPKCNQLRVRTAPGSGIDGSGKKLPRARAAQPFEILLVLDDRAEGRLHGGFAELGLAQCDQGASPVERLGDPGQLVEVEAANPSDQRADLACQLGRYVRQASRDDLVLPLHRRVVDPEIETSALERVVDLARSVRGDDDRRGPVCLVGADLGAGDVEVGEQFEREGLELVTWS